MKRKMRVAFAGGGSGGHLYPQIAVAGCLQKLDPRTEIFFVSTKGSIEERLIPKAGYELVLIPSGKLKGQAQIEQRKTVSARRFYGGIESSCCECHSGILGANP